MGKVTKKAKGVTITYTEFEVTQRDVKYQCPTCKTTYQGHVGVTFQTIRFRCNCGQELRIDERKKVDSKTFYKR